MLRWGEARLGLRPGEELVIKGINGIRHLLVHFEAKVEEKERERRGGVTVGQVVPRSPPHKRKGLVAPAGCVPAWGGMLIRGWGRDIPTPPTAPIPIPGIERVMGAMPAMGTMVMG